MKNKLKTFINYPYSILILFFLYVFTFKYLESLAMYLLKVECSQVYYVLNVISFIILITIIILAIYKIIIIVSQIIKHKSINFKQLFINLALFTLIYGMMEITIKYPSFFYPYRTGEFTCLLLKYGR